MEEPPASLPRRVVTAFGGVSKLAKALGHKHVTTVHQWQTSGRIPSWRKREIREAAEREGVTLPDDFDPPSPTPTQPQVAAE